VICRPTYRAQRRRWRCSQLVAKGSDRTTPTLTRRSFQHLLEERLTRRQHDALARAHEAGYYEWPRRTTADELADSLGVSAPTFHKHLRGAEDKFVGALFETPSVGSARKRINTD
jgi:predicted DNA binding protein